MLSIDDLHGYQHKARAHLNAGADSLLIAGVGSGKTATILTALQDKREAGHVRRTLIVAPPRVAKTVWPAESSEWSHLSSDFSVLSANGSPAKRLDLIKSGAGDAVSLSYDNLNWFFANFCNADKHPFDAVVFDEIDMMCNPSSMRLKHMKRYIKHFNTRIGCTATFTSTGLLNLWAQTYLLDQGESLGRSFERFKTKYFYATDFNQHNWEPHTFAESEIMARISLIAHMVDASTAKRNPPIVSDVDVKYADAVINLDRRLKRDGVIECDGVIVSADNSAALAGKRQQLAAGFLYGEDVKGQRATVWLDTSKFDVLDQLIKAHAGEQVLVIYQYTAQAEEFSRRYPNAPTSITDSVIDKWNARKIPLVAAHPASMSHGINMQKGGARIIVYLTPPWTNRRYVQVNGRLNRQGNPFDDILVYRLLAERSNDHDAVEVLSYRGVRDQTYLDTLESYCDAA